MNHIEKFNNILQSFKINANCINYKSIDNYFFYDIKLSQNAKVKDITKFSDEISLLLKTPCKPSIKIVREEGFVRLEFVSHRSNKLKLFDYFINKKVPKMDITCLLGQSVNGERMWMDLAANPHLLIAGTTGSGKSTLIHNIIANLLNYNNVELHLIDTKQIEFSEYSRRLKSVKVYQTYESSVEGIKEIISIMEYRYSLPNLKYVKPIVLIIDEFADLIMQDKDGSLYDMICKLAQKCRAAKIHIVLATQRPSVDVISGVIKANFPARIACRVLSHVDSKVILDATGAENLLGSGDALVRDTARFLERFQIAFTNAKEICDYFGEV